jgi:hypothetical protein
MLFSDPKPTTNAKPESVFAVISISVPIIAFLAALGVIFLSSPDPDSGHMGMRDFFHAAAILFFSFIGGTLSGFIALARREKSLILILVGLLLNGCPLLWMLAKIVLHN